MSQEKRQAVRLPCDLPIRLHGIEETFDAHLVDVSRLGLRVRIPGEMLRVHRLSSLAQISRRLTEFMGEAFSGDLHPDLLGSLIKKELKPTRIVKQDWERTDVEVGCVLGAPLSDQEVGMLGVPLPPIGDRRKVSRDAVPVPKVRTNNSAPRARPPVGMPTYQAFIYPAAGKDSKPLPTRTHTLSRGMAYLEIERMAGWNYDKMDLNQVVLALDDAYGSNVLLRIVDKGKDLWAGPAEIKDVDVSPSPSGIRLGLSFGRQLGMDELGRLGVTAPA